MGLNFDQRLNTITLKVHSPQDNVVFRNIRIPASLQNVLPLVAGQNPVEQTYKALYGKAFYPKCVVGQGYVQTFDKKTYSYQVDECDHLMTALKTETMLFWPRKLMDSSMLPSTRVKPRLN